MMARLLPTELMVGFALACSMAAAQDEHPIDVELSKKPEVAKSIVTPDLLAPAIIHSKALQSLVTRAVDFAFIASQAKSKKPRGLGQGIAALDDPVGELQKLTQPQLFRLGLAVGLDDPALLDRWRKAVLTGSSVDRLNARPTILNNDLRPGLIAGVTRGKAIERVALPHVLDGELAHGNSGSLADNRDFRRFVWQACEDVSAQQSKRPADNPIQAKPQSSTVDPLAEIDADLFEELGNLPILPVAPAGNAATAGLIDRRPLRLAIGRKILSSLDAYELARLSINEKRFELIQDTVVALLFSKDGESLMSLGWDSGLSPRLTKRHWDVASGRTQQAGPVKGFSLPIRKIQQGRMVRDALSPKQNWLSLMVPNGCVLDGWNRDGKGGANSMVLGEGGTFWNISLTPQGKLLTASQASRNSEILVYQLERSGLPERPLVSLPTTRKIQSQGLPLAVHYGTLAFSLDRHPTRPLIATAVVRNEASIDSERPLNRSDVAQRRKLGAAMSAIKLNTQPTTLVELHDLSTGESVAKIPDVGHGKFSFVVHRYYPDYDMHRLAPRSDYHCLTRFSPDGKTLFAGYSLIDVSTSRIRARLERHDTIFDVAFAPNGAWLATIGHGFRQQKAGESASKSLPVATHVLRFWESRSGKLLAEIDLGGESLVVGGNDVIAPSLALSPSAEVLATTLGTQDATVRLWNVVSILARQPKVPGLDPAMEPTGPLADQFYDFAEDALRALDDRNYPAALRGFERAIENMESHGETVDGNSALFEAYENHAITLGLMKQMQAADAEFVRLLSVSNSQAGIQLKLNRQLQLQSLQRSISRDPQNPHLFDLLEQLVRRFEGIDRIRDKDRASSSETTNAEWVDYPKLVDRLMHNPTRMIENPRSDEERARGFFQRAFLHTMKMDFASAKQDIDRAIEIDAEDPEFAEQRRRIEIAMHMARSPGIPIPESLGREVGDDLTGTTWRRASRGRQWTFLKGGILHGSTFPSWYRNTWKREGNQLKVTIAKGRSHEHTIPFLIERDVLRLNTSSVRSDDYWILERAEPEIELDRPVAYKAFVAGAAWANALLVNLKSGGKEDKVAPTWKLAEDAAKRLEIELPPLPRMSGSQPRDLRTTLMQLFRTRAMTEAIAASHSPREAYYFELAVSIKLTAPLIAAKQDALLKTATATIERAETAGGLPPKCWRPFVDLLKSDSPETQIREMTIDVMASSVEFLRQEKE